MSASVAAQVGSRPSDADVRLVNELVHRIAAELSMITEREVRILACEVQRSDERAAGAGVVHLSFKQTYRRGDRIDQGCLLVPLPDALALAGYFLMHSDEAVAQQRASTSVDAATKEALLEVASFVAGSLNTALLGSGVAGIQVSSASCQGVRPDALPVLVGDPGSGLWIARAKMQIHTYGASDVLLMMPCITDEDARSAVGASVSSP